MSKCGNSNNYNILIIKNICVFTLLMVLVSCGKKNITNLKAEGDLIICFGDSLTGGMGAGEGEDYPSILRKSLKTDIMNAGKGGDTTADALNRINYDVLQYNPRIVILEFGGNDYLKKMDIKDTKRNLSQLIEEIQINGSMVVLVGFKFSLIGGEYADMYNELAEKYGCVLVPNVLKGILTNQKYKSDQIHPNAEGYKIMAERIQDKLKPLIEKANKARKK